MDGTVAIPMDQVGMIEVLNSQDEVLITIGL